LLPAIQAGLDWREGARKLFKGEGSLGNGGAMRIGPLGGYFADNLSAVVEHARLATEVTHAHAEGVAGGIAIAVGAAIAAQLAGSSPAPTRAEFIDRVLPHVPAGVTRDMISKARDLPTHQPLEAVIEAIGNGSAITAMDTVPFCLWVVGETFGNYVEAFWLTARAGGDRDTTCAIVGGMAALSVAEYSPLGVPAEWLQHREPLPAWAFESGEQD
jgi:ADP-ribosylglycohydrolase